MNLEDLQDFIEEFAPPGLDWHDLAFDQLTDLMTDAGIDVSELSNDQIDSLTQVVSGHETVQHGEIKFGAGTCSHCGGAGKSTWPSSGTVERCWYCGGSGVA